MIKITLFLALYLMAVPLPIVEAPTVIVSSDQPQASSYNQLELKAILYDIANQKGLTEAKIAQIEGVIGGIPGTGCPNGESTWKPEAVGDQGTSYGLVQINLPANPGVTPKQALDPFFAIEFIVDEFLKGNEHRWTCYREIYG